MKNVNKLRIIEWEIGKGTLILTLCFSDRKVLQILIEIFTLEEVGFESHESTFIRELFLTIHVLTCPVSLKPSLNPSPLRWLIVIVIWPTDNMKRFPLSKIL